MEMNWYCIRSHQKKEYFASYSMCAELGVDTFCPRISQVKKTKCGKKRFTDAMFPCYFFAKFDLGEHLRQISCSRGVSRVLKFGNSFPVVPEIFLESMREGLDDDILYVAESELKVENRILIVSGPFEGLIGKLIRTHKGEERLTILIDLLGSQTDVNIAACDVMPLAS
jgi:transcriptional antiterminator RfaH